MKMKKLALAAATLACVCATARGQGQFLFNTHDPTMGNDVRFDLFGYPTSGPDWFVEVLAGTDPLKLLPLTPLLPLNRTGAGAGYTSPFAQIYQVPGLPGGSTVDVGFRAFQGISYADAAVKTELQYATAPVLLTEPPTVPSEVLLGTHVLAFIPEPSTWLLSLIGIGTLAFFPSTSFRARRST